MSLVAAHAEPFPCRLRCRLRLRSQNSGHPAGRHDRGLRSDQTGDWHLRIEAIGLPHPGKEYLPKIGSEIVDDAPSVCIDIDQRGRIDPIAHLLDSLHNDTAVHSASSSSCQKRGNKQVLASRLQDRILSRCCKDTGFPCETRIGNNPSENTAGHLFGLHDRDRHVDKKAVSLLRVSRRWQGRTDARPSEAERQLIGMRAPVSTDMLKACKPPTCVRSHVHGLRPLSMADVHGRGAPVLDGRTAIRSPRNAEVAADHRSNRQRRLTVSLSLSVGLPRLTETRGPAVFAGSPSRPAPSFSDTESPS